MKRIIIGLMAVGLFTGCGGTKETQNNLSSKEQKKGWELLFDGKTTQGWKGFQDYEMGKGWVVEDGTLHCLGKGGDIGGDIISEKEYENFELSLEWKISPGGNSGIFYHVVENAKYHAPYETGPEYQIIDDIGFPSTLEEWQKTGADYAMHLPNKLKELKPVGEWNTTRIVFNNGHVEHWLNGKKIVEFQTWTKDWQRRKEACKWKDYPDYGMTKKGHVGLQDHGNQVWYQNIKIHPL